VERLNANLKEKGIVIGIRDDGIGWILERTLKDRSYGARPLRRAIQRHIEDALSEAFIRGEVLTHTPIEIGVHRGALWYWQDERGGELSA
jgi:ATP-dependent Clp protease ATP-binding subunit ClpC